MYGKKTFNSVDTKNIGENTIDRIFEIEQDMWARGIGEYVKCGECEKIYSKNDIYGKGGGLKISKKVQLETVMKIESLLGGVPNCPDCECETAHIYGHEYIGEIEQRYKNKQSFLSLAHNENGEIIGFMDGYIASLGEIYEQEFSFHFSEGIVDEIYDKYDIDRDAKLLTFSSIGTEDKNKSILTIFGLLRNFFDNMSSNHDNISSIYESIINTSTYCTFVLMGASKMDTHKKPALIKKGALNDNFTTDILLQKNVVQKYKECFNIRARDVVKFSKMLNSDRIIA